MAKLIYLFILLGVVSSCNLNNRQYTRILKSLDESLDENPEMVLDSLRKIDPDLLQKHQQAYLYLLLASATDKNLIYLDNDSTLNIAYEYYKAQNDDYSLARCQYYLGKYELKRKKLKDAYELFKQAEMNFFNSKEQNTHLLGLIYYQLGTIQKQQMNFFESENLFQKSYEAFLKVKDTIPATHSLRSKGIVQIASKNYKEAEQNLLQSLELSSSIKEKSSRAREAKNNVLISVSYFYRKRNNLELALNYGKECLKIYQTNSEDTPSPYYYNITTILALQNEIDSARFYCNRMITSAKKEKNNINIINGYNVLSLIEEKAGNYSEACKIKNYFNKLKDSINKNDNKKLLFQLERKYEKVENQRLLLKAENSKLKAYAISSIIFFGVLILGLPFYFRHRNLKMERDRLSKAIKHTEWGFLVTKEFITENHLAYDELERILNREKSLNNLSSEMYTKFHEALILQKANYSGRLFNRLTNFDGNFIAKFQQRFPDFTTDELLMAMMIHHQWKVSDMATIFHISVDALRKRKSRLAHKISHILEEDIDLEEYLSKI